VPLIEKLGESKKVFLASLARNWLSPCCDDPGHLVNYREQGYLPRLNNSISALRDCNRDSLYSRRVSNYRILCPNKMIRLDPALAASVTAKQKSTRPGGEVTLFTP
jgi:hypothetical protein